MPLRAPFSRRVDFLAECLTLCGIAACCQSNPTEHWWQALELKIVPLGKRGHHPSVCCAAKRSDPSASEVPAVWEPGSGDQVARRVVRSVGSHQDLLVAEGDWCHNLVEFTVSVGV